MADLEKVIKGLECHREQTVCVNEESEVCPYFSYEDCHRRLTDDALELLKEREAVKPYMDYDGQDVWRCGECGNSLMHPSYYACDNDAKNHIRYCSHCGRAIKWGEPPKEGDSE